MFGDSAATEFFEDTLPRTVRQVNDPASPAATPHAGVVAASPPSSLVVLHADRVVGVALTVAGVYLATRPTGIRGLTGGVALVLSSLSNPFTSSMNWAMSLNWRYTDAKRT